MRIDLGMSLLSFAIILFYICLIGVGSYCVILLIKLMKRGIRVLDLIIKEKTHSRYKGVNNDELTDR